MPVIKKGSTNVKVVATGVSPNRIIQIVVKDGGSDVVMAEKRV